VSRRTRAVLILLMLAGASVATAVVISRPGAFVLERTLLVRQEERPEQVAFVPGKNSVLFGARYSPIAIFDLDSGAKRELFPNPGHGNFTLSADGLLAAVVMPGPELRIYDLPTGRVHQTFPFVPVDGREGMAWSPDGQFIALADKRAVAVLDLKRSVTRTLPTGVQDDFVNSVAFSPDGRLLGTGTWAGVVSLWLTASWTLAQELDLGSNPGTGPNGMCSVAFSRDGSLFAAGGGSAWGRTDGSPTVTHGALRVWRTRDRTVVLSMDLEKAADSLSFSPDGTRLAYSTWGRVQVVDLGTGKEIWCQPHAASGMNPAVGFGQDGRLMTLDSRGPIRIWKSPP
jgi:WD40 repeat protein